MARAAWVACATAGAGLSAFAATPPAWRDAAVALQLSAQQVQALEAAAGPWQRWLDANAASPPDDARCRESQQRQAAAQTAARAVLNAGQTERLAALEQALLTMPAVESAQAALLLPPTLRAAPRGLPAGTIDGPVAYVRTTPQPLPGCRPETPAPRPGQEILVPRR